MSQVKAQMAKVHYQVVTFSGTMYVPCMADFSDDVIKAKARAELQQQSGKMLPLGEQVFQVTERV